MTGERQGQRPDNLVVVLLDSLNRHLLGPYGGTEFATPTIDAFAASALRFTAAPRRLASVHAGPPRHPGRRPRLPVAAVGLDRGVGGRRDPVAAGAGVTTMLVSDHPHLFETGGENYHTDFTAWEYERGHENDPWRTTPDPTWLGAPALPVERPAYHHAYDDSRTWFRTEEDFPGPRTMRAARRVDPDRGAAPRPVLPDGRRVRPPRALRHARALRRHCTTR